jgi:mRNA interferase HicA
VKKRDLERVLTALGWRFLRQGGSHEIWTNGLDVEAIPRHAEINENTAKAIIKRVRDRPPGPG